MSLPLNSRAAALCDRLVERAEELRIAVSISPGGTRVVDMGIKAPGGLEAGRLLAEVCLAGLGRVQFVPSAAELWSGWSVTIATDQPVLACMASQYAGWQVSVGKYFAMASGPMRAASAREELLIQLGI